MRRFRSTLLAAALVMGAWAIPAQAAAGPVVNGRIAFTSERDAGNGEIYRMNADGTDQVNLSNNAAFEDEAAWSPDGTKVAFTSERDGNDEIYVMNADGSGQIRLTNAAGADTYADWSPDGTRIAFTSTRDGNSEIYVMNADGSGQTNLTNNSAGDFYPSWSPDGSRLAFSSIRDGNYEIYVMNADGSGQTNISNNAAFDQEPAWSPNGTTIAFTSNRDGQSRIFAMAPDGSGQTPLMTSGYGEEAAWSPDGTMIAFTSYPVDNYEVSVMRADGSGLVNVSNQAADDYRPEWQPAPVSVAKARVKEGKPARFQLTLGVPSGAVQSLAFEAVRGSAKRGKDFKATSGSLQLVAGQVKGVMKVKTREDGKDERKERFSLELTFPSGAVLRAKGIILDDD